MNDTCVTRNRVLLAVTAIAFGVGLLTMAGVNWYYESKISTLVSAHKRELSTVEARHSREKKRLHEGIQERLQALHDRRCNGAYSTQRD